MNKERLELVVNQLVENISTIDLDMQPQQIKPLLYKIYTKSLVSQICDVQPLSSPIGKIFFLSCVYSGLNGDLNESSSTILSLSSISGYSLNSTISTSNGSGTIMYIEDTNVLVKINSGYFNKGSTTIENSATINDVITNKTYARKVFKNYSKFDNTHIAETSNAINQLDYEITAHTIQTNTRKIKSRFSQEAIQDMKTMFKADINQVLTKEFASEIIQEIDMEVINYMRQLATPMSDIVLSNSYGTQNDLSAIASDIYANIYLASQDILRENKRKQQFFVLSSVNVASLLMINPLHVKPEIDIDNSYYVGKLGNIFNMYVDPYSTDEYVLVGYMNAKGEDLGDASIIFAPYTNEIIKAIEPDSGKEVYFNILRYGYTNHPQDVGEGNADSKFLKIMHINISNLINFPR